MSLFDILSVAALAASIVLLFDAGARLPAFAAVAAAGLQAGILFHVLQVRTGTFPLPMVLAAAVLAAAGFAWTRAQAKPGVTAATAAVLAGAIQLLRGFKIV
ncbi:MAG TPA: hypothetical protein VFM45_02535 [Anaeromyxobacteraceae bacterium]|nr:hypothetical protein [Anaeromyxobacteraceae bacterium]